MQTREFSRAFPRGGVCAYTEWSALQQLALPPDVCTLIFEYTHRPANGLVTRLIASRLNPKALRQAYDLDHTPVYRDFDTVWDFMGKRLKDRTLAEHWHTALTR